MKSIIYLTKFIVLAIIALFVTSCENGFSGIQGSGNEKTEQRKIAESFDKLEVKKGIELHISEGNEIKIAVTTDDNLLEFVETSVSNGTLNITTTEFVRSANGIKVFVTIPQISELSASSGSTITTDNTITGTNLIAKASSGSEMDLEVEIENLQTQTSSGSAITLSGKALSLNAKTSSGSEFNSAKLFLNDATIQASSGSSAEVYASQNLNAKASSGSSINYQGNPKSVQKTKSSGGSISPR